MASEKIQAITPRDVAAELLVKVDVVLAWIAAGELTASNVARPGAMRPRWRILREDVEAFLQRRRNQAKKISIPKRKKIANVIEFYK